MNTKAIMKIGFALRPEDAQRIGIELTKSDDGRFFFTATYLSTRANPKEGYKDFRTLFDAIFKTPDNVFCHCEDQIDEYNADDKTERTVKITEMSIRGEALV